MYLTTLDLTKYTTLGSADYPAYTLYDSIAEVIRQRISPEAAALLAEPTFDDSSQQIDYMVAAEGEFRTLDSLTDDEIIPILDKLTSYSTEIRSLADSYVKSNDPQAKRIGQILRHALYVPETADIYVVDGEPVLTGWGLKHRVGGAPFDICRSQSMKADLTPATPAPTVSPEQTEPTERLQVTNHVTNRKEVYVEEERKRFPWLRLLLAILGFLLLLFLLWWLFSNDIQPASVTSSPPVLEPEQPVAKEPATPKDLTATPPAHASDTTVLVIPQRSIETGDMGFLYGEWASITDLISTVSKEPLAILYAFDHDGSGTTTIIREPSGRCEAPVKAEFKPDGRLYIQDQTDVLCEDDVYFPKSSVICEVVKNGQAVCLGQQMDNQYNITLKRSGKQLSTTEQLERELTANSGADSRLLNSDAGIEIPVATIHLQSPRYEREYFGRGWGDDDNDCQNTRHEILIALSTSPVRFTNGRKCSVLSGKWISPFTNQVHYSGRDLDIDHQVPLKWAWDHGAYEWDAATRYRFANDPVNLLPVEASLNRSKGASGLEWLPPNNQCAYVARFLRIIKLYDLKFLPAEADHAKQLLAQCDRTSM